MFGVSHVLRRQPALLTHFRLNRPIHTIKAPEKIASVVDTTFRDGIQKLPFVIPVLRKIEVIELLLKAGLSTVEVGSFVKGLPNVDNPEELYHALQTPSATMDILVPNEKGYIRAEKCYVPMKPMRISLFTAASDTFAEKNSGLSFERSMTQFASIIPRAKGKGIKVRAFLSCAFGCPFEGDKPLGRSPLLTRRLLDLGCDEVVPSDTTGVGTAGKVHDYAKELLGISSNEASVFKRIALHLHGDDLERVGAGLQWGIVRYDASLGKVGGCPATTKAQHNINMISLLSYLHLKGYQTGIDMDRVRSAQELFLSILKDCQQQTPDRQPSGYVL